MRIGFGDETRIKKASLAACDTGIGSLRLWHLSKYKTLYPNVLFEDRTYGDLLEEFYLGVTNEWNTLRSATDPLSRDQEDRLHDLDRVLGVAASSEELQSRNDKAWTTVRATGDPLGDYWEYRAAHGLITTADFDLKTPPPAKDWAKP